MSITRIHKTKDFTVMSNHHFKNKSLSLKAKGLLSLMLSLPDDWDYSIEGLATLSSDGSTAVRTALKELEEQGYLYRQRIYTNGRISDIEYHIFESPKDCKQYEAENLNVENLIQENLTLENKDNKILNKQNTKNNKNTKEDKSQKVVNLYHSICVSLPTVRSITDKRKKAIQAIFKKGYTIDDLQEAFTLAEQSDFMKGKNDRSWVATFDFFFREDKLIAILEGKYGGSKKSRDGLQGTSDSHERKADMRRRVENGELQKF